MLTVQQGLKWLLSEPDLRWLRQAVYRYDVGLLGLLIPVVDTKGQAWVAASDGHRLHAVKTNELAEFTLPAGFTAEQLKSLQAVYVDLIEARDTADVWVAVPDTDDLAALTHHSFVATDNDPDLYKKQVLALGRDEPDWVVVGVDTGKVVGTFRDANAKLPDGVWFNAAHLADMWVNGVFIVDGSSTVYGDTADNKVACMKPLLKAPDYESSRL